MRSVELQLARHWTRPERWPISFLLVAAVVFTHQQLPAQLVNDGANTTLANVTNSITGTVTVGTNGSFTLLVLSDNALLTNSTHGVIGRNASANSNEVQLLRSTARWQMGANLFVGSNGAFNRLVVSDGALVNNNNGLLGNGAASSNNFALVTGSGSLWTNRTDLTVGVSGPDNQLIVSNGARVVSRVGNVGQQPGSSNNLVVVTGSGSSWTNHSDVNVGVAERGNRLIVEAGGQVGGDNGRVGSGFGGQGEALVTGAGSLWSSRTDLAVGLNPPNNRLVVSNGAAVVAGNNGRLGASTGATGNEVIVTGAGSLWSNRFELYVGEASAGNRMEVNGGGWVVSSNTHVGRGLSALGNLALVTGAGSFWSNRADLFIGNSASGGRFEVREGGTMSTGRGVLGSANGTFNAIFVADSGSRFLSGTELIVGHSGPQNSLIVSNGGLVVSSNAFLGYANAGSNNSAMVIGAGSLWSIRNELTVGSNSPGNRVEVRDGGRVFVNGSTFMGHGGPSTSNLILVTGPGSLWTNASGFTFHLGVGGAGNQLIVSNGGSMQAASFSLSSVSSHNNQAVFTGPGTSLDISLLEIGGNRNRLSISDGASLVTSAVSVGNNSSSFGNELLVTGPGSIWRSHILKLGTISGRHRLVLTNGGELRSSVTPGLMNPMEFIVGEDAASTNNRVVVDGGVLRAGNTDLNATFDVRRGTNVFNAGLIDVDVLLLTNTLSRFEFNGGTLITRGADIRNNTTFDVGNTGSTRAVWDVRAGVSDHFLADSVRVGLAGSFAQLIHTSGALLTNDGPAYLGGAATSRSNSATVAGPASRWLLGDGMVVGEAGSDNRLVVRDGALLVTASRGTARRRQCRIQPTPCEQRGNRVHRRFGNPRWFFQRVTQLGVRHRSRLELVAQFEPLRRQQRFSLSARHQQQRAGRVCRQCHWSRRDQQQ